MTLFLKPTHLAAGSGLATLHSSGRSRELSASRADHAGARDLHQKVGLDEVDISLGEGGTLFLPPSSANGFRTRPHTRTPATVCALRQNGGIMVTPVLHVLPLTIRSAYLQSLLFCCVLSEGLG